MIAGLILILSGIITLFLGIGGTAKMKIEGLAGGIVITLSGASGIILMVLGALVISVPP